MGNFLPSYKKAIYDELANNIFSNTSQYYAFASNPVPYTNNIPLNTTDYYSSVFLNDWNMLFGKKISSTDIMPIIKNNIWTTNTVYSMYDNTDSTLYSNNNYYVIVSPSIVGGDYTIFKCINNANGSVSTNIPDQIQPSSFTKSDGYTWRYITSISSALYTKFATTNYVPIYPNTSIQSSAYNYSGIEVINISNGGLGYISYHDGYIRSVVNSTLVQIESTASVDNNFYTKNGIYIYNTSTSTSQLKTVSQYISNSSGNWVYLDSPANTTNITPSITQYKISPKVVFNTDADVVPSAYTIVNTYSNSISQIKIIDPGYGISWANVSIESNTSYGSGANVYGIVPFPGGHGSSPETELNMLGYCVSFNFSNTQSNTIPTNIQYNKIGILKNPHVLNSNNTKGIIYSSNTYNSLLVANVSPSITMPVGTYVKGTTSNALGIVAFSNSTVIYLTGDKKFKNNEIITSSDNLYSTTININSLGNIYTKDLIPLYIQNINNVTRSNTQNESFKLVVQI